MITRTQIANFGFLAIFCAQIAISQDKQQDKPEDKAKAQAIVAKAVQFMGGDRYLGVKTQIGRGKYSQIRENAVASFQSFMDVIVFPDKERTEFKGGGAKMVQTNTGKTGWVYDGAQDLIKVQTDKQVADFLQGNRVSLDNLLRGYWKGNAELTYVGRRQAGLGTRNNVVRLTYNDGFIIEYEFADDGTPAKSVYKHLNGDSTEITEEDHYAQFIDVEGAKAAFIIDRFTDGHQASRINYESIEFNKSIPESVFEKPSNPKDLKKDLKLQF
jgi:hypothetical protein